MKIMSTGQLSAACDGTLYVITNEAVTSVTMDSRAVRPGSLFVALKGERADGHDYIQTAFENGAACALVERLPEYPPEHGSVILVPDCRAALLQLAGAYRASFAIPIVGVTGSVGKTTAKEMVAAVLSRRFSTHRTEGNLNNDLGVPLTLFGMEASHEAAVIEMGISHFGEMRELASAVLPTMVLMTNIGFSHLEFLGSPEGVLRAKSEIFEAADPDGTAFLNGDDALLRGLSPKMRETVYFGLGEGNDFRAFNVVSSGSESVECDITGGGMTLHASIPGFGEHLVYAALAAAAIGWKLGLSAEEIAGGISDFHTTGRRASIRQTETLTVIDDCYNANPGSVKAAISSLASLRGRRVAILGDMRELGEQSARLHFEVGEAAQRAALDKLICVGQEARQISRAAGGSALWYADKEALIRDLPSLIRKGDHVLVKASRGMALESVVEALLALS